MARLTGQCSQFVFLFVVAFVHLVPMSLSLSVTWSWWSGYSAFSQSQWTVHWRFVLSGEVLVRKTAVMEQLISLFLHMLCDVFLCRFIVIMKRAYLRTCAFDNRPTVCDPDCCQCVTDDHSRVSKSIGWLLGCTRTPSPEPNGLPDMKLALVVFRGVL